MSASRLALIDEVMRSGIAAGGFPGGAVIVGRRSGIVWERGYGTLDWKTGTRVDAERTMYDVASLTKVVATTAATMVLVDRGKLRLDEPVVHSLPAFAGRGREEVTIRDLLMHRSGLPAGRVLSEKDRRQRIGWCLPRHSSGRQLLASSTPISARTSLGSSSSA